MKVAVKVWKTLRSHFEHNLGLDPRRDTHWMYSNLLFLQEATHENIIYNTGLTMRPFGFPAGA